MREWKFLTYTSIGGRYAVSIFKKNAMTEIALFYCTNPL